ncbi:beta-propeller repeat protein [Leptospira fainei serovar Hurstbridge str. BUT 6]|uniref:Beta-propeller repeat protein n=1 Tax=Leptospira fainei serovar Hurstbridge str. BUT 6 TaxID=1193011 RepID=S3V6C3_9LEPT|nr:SBBP repeat-containing protein [Leptospira fainei]EPG76214.1 beta-propeller repeat protein [Leptospira fainei serovar Hurstbridge str. BUT 6]
MRIFKFPYFLCFISLVLLNCLKTEFKFCDDSGIFTTALLQGFSSRKGSSFCGYLKSPLPTASWTRLLGAAGASTQSSGVTADGSGNVYAAGSSTGSLDGNALIGTQDAFVVKYDTNGNKQWTRTLGTAGASLTTSGIASDSFQNVYMLGSTNLSLDGQAFSGTSDLFLSKYDTNGNKLWTRLLGALANATLPMGIATDSFNFIYITGYTNGNLDGNVLTGLYDLFLTKYDPNGIRLWTRTLGVSGAHTQSNAVTLDSSNSVYMTGYTTGNLDGNVLAGGQDLIVVKYDSNGNKQWTRQLGVAAASETGNGIVTDMRGNIYATGNTNGNLDGQTLTGTFAFFVVKYDNQGAKQWTRLLGTGGTFTYGLGITYDSFNNVFITGNTGGGLDGNTLTGTQDIYMTKYDSNGVKQSTQQAGVTGSSSTASGIVSDYYDNIYKTGYTAGNLNGQILVGTNALYIIKN